MIRFIFRGVATDLDIPAHTNAIGPAALAVSGAESDCVFSVRQTSEAAWIVTVQGQTITAEVIDADS